MNKSEFIIHIKNLVGKTSWRVAAGVSTGSRVLFYFGERIHVRFANGELSEEGEFSFFVGTASWRVSKDKKILATSWDIFEEESEAQKGLLLLEGNEITEIILGNHYDLVLKFQDELELSIFCNDTQQGAENYSFSIRERTYSVDCNDGKMEVNIEIERAN